MPDWAITASSATVFSATVLPPGVATGDDQQVEVAAQPHVDGHDGVALLGRHAGLLLVPGLVDQQRVAGLDEAAGGRAR